MTEIDWKAKYEELMARSLQQGFDLRQEIAQLKERLEVDPRYPYDGIDCRNAAIGALNSKCDRLKSENETMRAVLKDLRGLFTDAFTVDAIDAAMEQKT